MSVESGSRKTSEVLLGPAEPKVSIAMLSIVGIETCYLPFCFLRTYTKAAEAAGASLDFWPIGPIPSKQVNLALVPDKDLAAITSASSSYRAEKTWRETLKHPNKLLAVQSRILLPHKDNVGSLNVVTALRLSLLGDRLGNDKRNQIPTVLDMGTVEMATTFLKANPTSRQHRELNGLVNTSVQATEELFTKYGLNSAENLDRFLKEFSLKGFCFNTVDSRFLLKNPQLLKEVFSRTICAYVKVFRSDSLPKGVTPDQLRAEGLDLLNGTKNTNITDLLQLMKTLGFNGPYILVFNISQMPPDVKKTAGDVILRPEDIGPNLKPVVDNTKSILSRA